MSFRQSFLITLLVGFIVTSTFLAGFWARDWLDREPNFPVLEEAHALVIKHGLPTPPAERALEYGMIRGMLQAYGDPFTSFNEPVQAELQSNRLQGSFGGIGVNLGRDAEGYHVFFPYPDSPASQAGILDADRILTIDSLRVSPETSVEDIQAAIRGPVGTEVVLWLARAPDYAEFEITVEREQFSLPSILRYQDPRQPLLGVVRVNLIASTTPEELKKAIEELQALGSTSFALDLRDNFGGLLKEGAEIAGLFLKEGEIIHEQHRDQPATIYRNETPGVLSDIPLVVLINQHTASAAEIVAGAVQAQGRAALIGTPSYGKDAIQVVFTLQDQSSLQITSGRWYIPGWDLPRARHGLQPDILVDPAVGDPDPSLLKAIEVLFPIR